MGVFKFIFADQPIQFGYVLGVFIGPRLTVDFCHDLFARFGFALLNKGPDPQQQLEGEDGLARYYAVYS